MSWIRAVVAFCLVMFLCWAAPAQAAEVQAAPAQAAPVCTAPTPSTTKPGYLVADPDCDLNGTPFTPLAGATVHTGIRDGAAYRIEVPANWNGSLVVYAHGFRGTGTTVYVGDPELRAHYVSLGYAWAASSFATNGYDVAQGVHDSVALIDVFRAATGKRARSVLMTGASMGGHITGVAIEQNPRAFAGAMPYCGVLGDTALFDYFLDANVTAAALAGVKIEFPLQPGADYQARWRTQVAQILPALGVRTGAPPQLTAAGRTWAGVVERRSGGDRPGFDGAFAYWNSARSLEPLADLPFLFGLWPGIAGGTENIAPGNVTDNTATLYRSTDDWWPTVEEWRLNVTALRVKRTVPPGTGIPRINGNPRVPVLSMHDVGDLFVPLSMEQQYATRAAHNGRSGLFVSRAIRGVGHCDFTQAELAEGFDDLTTWLRTGVKPAGDPILDRRAVADPAFGCRYTRGAHPGFAGEACPATPIADIG